MQQKDLPTDLKSTSIVPNEAFLFFPREKEIRRITSQGAERIIFEGNVEYDVSERKHIHAFVEEARKKFNFTLPEDWPESETLRFLQANQFKYKPTVKALQEYLQWRDATIPVTLTPTVEKYLQKGIVYFFGRDCRMRPILVMNGHLMNPKYVDIDIFIESLTFLLEYVIRELLLPGQIENWHVVGDLNGCGITELPISALKKIFIHLQSHYRARLYKLHIFNAPNSIVLPWKMSRGFIEDTTREKVHFYKESTSEKLWKEINPAQVEQKFGGKAPNLTSYWPLTPCPQGFEASGDSLSESLVCPEKYYQMYKAGQLKGHNISQAIIKSVEAQILPNETKLTKRRSISAHRDTEETRLTECCDLENSWSDTEESTKMNKTVNSCLEMKPVFAGNSKKFKNSPFKLNRRLECL
mmetsp:Transcript_70981/g.82631  ORF Transcript_70981/g.82631 Transcript_70981/m.82631 type:complete len:412 (+) Transcript_70981:14-1249(+)